MRSAALLVVALACSCTIHRHVTLLLGPDDDTLTAGFSCLGSDGLPLFAAGYDAPTQTLSFNLVVDLVDVSQHVPSCLAEDIAAACADGECQLSVADAPTRFCQPVSVKISSISSAPMELIAALQEQFPEVISKAPNRPVIVRAVATLQPCDAGIETSQAGAWLPLDPSMALGCAYSCPLNLNDADGEVSLGLNVPVMPSDPACPIAVRDCASFPIIPM
jgi:hypothetical protein